MLRQLNLSFLFLCIAFTISNAQTFIANIMHDGEERSYRVHVPTGYEEGDELPLVFNFHGLNSSGFEQEVYSQMSPVADEENFFVVYPDGIGLIPSWNVGWSFGSTADDVGFTSAMIDTLHAEYNIDLTRVYSCGMSNGGFFSYKLACELNDRIAKIASVTGSMLQSELESCILESSIPVMQIHGTQDDVVSYNGTANISMGIEPLLEGWRNLNGCSAVSDTIAVENVTSLDFSTAELIQHRDCNDDVYMAFYKVTGGGHTWPGALINIGVTNQDFKATREIWDFFNDQYPKDIILDADEPDNYLEEPLGVWPNPSSDVFNLRSNVSDIEQVAVYNSLGQLVHSSININNREYTINAERWETGLYFIQTIIDGKNSLQQVIKR